MGFPLWEMVVFVNNGIKDRRKNLVGLGIPGIDADAAVRIPDA
jgi:hypothetical protein